MIDHQRMRKFDVDATSVVASRAAGDPGRTVG
jgi:hypothetical protein